MCPITKTLQFLPSPTFTIIKKNQFFFPHRNFNTFYFVFHEKKIAGKKKQNLEARDFSSFRNVKEIRLTVIFVFKFE